jgi:hypothetical protein
MSDDRSHRLGSILLNQFINEIVYIILNKLVLSY